MTTLTRRTAIQLVMTADAPETDGTGADYRLSRDVVLVKAWDGSSRLIDLGGDSFGLPEVSTALLEGTLRGGPAVAAEEVARRYAVPADRVAADLDAFLEDLGHRGLVARRPLPG